MEILFQKKKKKMSLKKIMIKNTSVKVKGVKKLINSDQSTHSKITLLSELYNITQGQVIHNIVSNFFKENEEEIKEKIEIKKNQLDELFKN